MAAVDLINVTVLDNPTKFVDPLRFEITFFANQALKDDLEWKVIYVGSANSEENDQVLDSVRVGPIMPGESKFIFEVDPPDPDRIPKGDLLGVTVVLLCCSYREREFVRVGYYVNSEYEDPSLNEQPPEPPQVECIQRNILADSPRVTRWMVEWD